MNFRWLAGMLSTLVFGLLVASSISAQETPAKNVDESEPSPLHLVVMDPLSAPLACDCVQGYAQRKYEKLAVHLAKQFQREVKIVWAESIGAALKETGRRADIVIGKHSVVLANAAEEKLNLQPIACLTDKEGSTMQTGLVVVRKDDPAAQLSDLKGYRLFFGPPECEEKYAAPMALLQDAGVEIPDEPETFGACSEAATKLMELPSDTKAAAIISSYAAPLLEGCKTIKKGDLRVLGETKPVRFISAFVDSRLDEPARQAIADALISAGENADLLLALETESGFEAFGEPTSDRGDEASSSGSAAATEQKKN